MYISYNVFVTKHFKINGIHIFKKKKENGNFMFLLLVKTVAKLIPTTITASESYLLSLAIIAYYKRLFPAHKQLCFKPFMVPLQLHSQGCQKTSKNHVGDDSCECSLSLCPQLKCQKLTEPPAWGRSRFTSIAHGLKAFGFADIRLLTPFSHIRPSDVIMGHPGKEDISGFSIPRTPSLCRR